MDPPKTILLTINRDSHQAYSKLIMTVVYICKNSCIIKVKNFYLMFKVFILSYPWLLKVKYGNCFVSLFVCFSRKITLVVISSIVMK